MLVQFTGDRITRGYFASIAVLITAGGEIANLNGATLSFLLRWRSKTRIDVTSGWVLSNVHPTVASPQRPHGFLHLSETTTALLPQGLITDVRTILHATDGNDWAYDAKLPEVI